MKGGCSSCGPFAPSSAVVAISEKDVLRAEDVFSVTLATGINGVSVISLTRGEIARLFSCSGIDKVIRGDNPVALQVILKCPERIHDVETLTKQVGQPCPTNNPSDVIGDYNFTLPGAPNLAFLGAAIAEPKTKVTRWKFVFDGTPIQSGTVQVSLCGIVAHTFGLKETYSSRFQPSNVRTVDRVLREDIQLVSFFRTGTGVAIPFSSSAVDALFDGRKHTCATPPFPFEQTPFQVGDIIEIVFHEPMQLESAQIVRLTTRPIITSFLPGSMDVPGTFVVAFADPGIPNLTLPDVAKAQIHDKVEGIGYIFTEPVGEICEITLKTFSHVDAQVVFDPGDLLSVSEKDVLSAGDLQVVLDNEVPLSVAEVKTLFDCNRGTFYQVATDLRMLLNCPQYIEEVEVFGQSGFDDHKALPGTWQIIEPTGAISSVTSTSRLELKRKVRAVTFVPDTVPVQVRRITARTFGSKHVHAPAEQPVNTNPRLEVVREDIFSVDIGGEPLKESEIQALFDKNSRFLALDLPSGEVLVVRFKKPLQVAVLEALDTDSLDIPLDWSASGPDGTFYDFGNLREVIAKAKIVEVFISNSSASNVEISELLFKTFYEVETHPDPAGSFAASLTAGAADSVVDFGFNAGSLGLEIINDGPAADILITFRKMNESVAPATGTAGRTFTLMAGERLKLDVARYQGVKVKRAGAISASFRILAW